jgi:hypothetical protein
MQDSIAREKVGQESAVLPETKKETVDQRRAKMINAIFVLSGTILLVGLHALWQVLRPPEPRPRGSALSPDESTALSAPDMAVLSRQEDSGSWLKQGMRT